ncbi:MAG: HD-GYP domain-containing protein [Actinomycetota bacterium]|nr:HD-GYP domain-containing protein [Actinomycetota bacterium]
MSNTKKLILQVYVHAVFIIGILLLSLVIIKYSNVSLVGVVLFGFLVFASDNLSSPLPKTGSVSVNFGITMASLILFGPATASIVTIISVFNVKEFLKKVPYYKHLFNAGQYLISIGVASIVFETFFKRSVDNFLSLNNIGIIFLSAIIFFFLNTTLTTGAITLSESAGFLNIWVFNFAWLIPFHIFLTLMAVAISFLYSTYGPFTLLFTSLPLIIAQYTYLLRIKERKALLSSILQIVKIMEAKDVYTAGHSMRVATYSEEIAREMKLNEYDVEIIKNLANLHDIGKIQVDLSILNKPAKLSLQDWEEVKKHPEVGYEIVREITFLKDAASGILYHHEKVDGSGYPRGLTGDQIPLFAKILCVADSYDAMTTDRPYTRALTKQEAIGELRRNSGTQFDEEVTGAMIKVLARQ